MVFFKQLCLQYLFASMTGMGGMGDVTNQFCYCLCLISLASQHMAQGAQKQWTQQSPHGSFQIPYFSLTCLRTLQPTIAQRPQQLSKVYKQHVEQPLSGHLGALTGDLGCFPLDNEAYPPLSHWLPPNNM
eukprot:TRINITY_DN32123_c0_g2_i4.p2 TRINITY_DN32123_c0_g2~~TRINITY_DN32123_c0_g2_i4.p2  ORF type:complete len:130 (+),score=2.59 TRINITY_DN32123_c0_g2_i4:512-901(+)